ncbi:uncharacterized protein FOMMEDRAFT_171151 [Fomitiporia mediterranea MF3/22]|uniref:uncharacterized protein n=1 Tax=Fomitiporia mediterranea (strain MF3/22) TaxID=694068 RepID=UPI0004408A1C|nr:uncharacterized protein FOMMEDRAFT_171151 [Fomitiporia mediterranea MF3/22]EJC98205.1 hypothetical protein FOMMEDRAFT_171151 [Fomitiporia mediterranea MF3/22]
MATTGTAVARSSLDNPELNDQIEKAKTLVASFASKPLSIADAEGKFSQKISAFNEIEPATAFTPRHAPQHVSAEVEAQLSFLRKLKFLYLEQYAKDKYIKTIVDDDAEIITVDDNEALRRSSEVKKANLKVAKERLTERNKQFNELASDVEDKYGTAKSLTDEFTQLTSQILDARHAIVRLRAAHPPGSRLSVASANATLETQTEQMTALDAQLSDNALRADRLKERMQEAARDVERLRLERAAKEDQARRTKVEEEDERVGGLYDWLIACLTLHRMLFSLVSHKAVAENELTLTYSVPAHPTSQTSELTQLTITLLFHPNTRILADASISSPDQHLANLNLADLIGSHVQSNDVLGLIRGILARVRHGA